MKTLAEPGSVRKLCCTSLVVAAVMLGGAMSFARAAYAQDSTASGQSPPSSEAPQSKPPAESSAPSSPPPSSVSSQPQGAYGYGWWVLAPVAGVVALTLLLRRLLPALFLGLLAGGYMITLGEARHRSADVVPAPGAADVRPYADMDPSVGGLRYTMEELIVRPLVASEGNYARAKLAALILTLGFSVGVIARGGGGAGLTRMLAGGGEAPRRGMFTAWLGSALFSFDRVTGGLIVGSSARSTFDRLKLSRAKLAAIVDMTALPAASVLIVGTWIGAEIGFVQQGLTELPKANLPTFLSEMDGVSAVVGSVPYRFYAVFAAGLMLWTCLMRRDFGPMLAAQSRAQSGDVGAPTTEVQVVYENKPLVPRWWVGFFPLLVLAVGSPWLLARSGYDAEAWNNAATPLWTRVAQIVTHGDALTALFYGAILCAITAVVLTFASRACTMREAVDAGLDGMSRQAATLVLVVLAWGMAEVSQRLGVAQMIVDAMRGQDGQNLLATVSPMWMPAALFGATAIVAFLTGAPLLSAGLLTPVGISLMARMYEMSSAGGTVLDSSLFYSGIAAVMTGAMFGGHCSPIGDTTLLSSVSTGCRHEEHVWTQLPYALVSAFWTVAAGYVVCNVYGQPWYYAMAAGVVVMFLLTLLLGRAPKAVPGPITAAPPLSPSPWQPRSTQTNRASGRP